MKIFVVVVVLVVVGFVIRAQAPEVRTEAYKIQGWPLKKSWGPLRSVVTDGQKDRYFFEDSAGTIRLVSIDWVGHTAEVVGEMKRE